MKSEMELFLKNLKDKGLEPSKVDETDDEYAVTLGMGMKNTNFCLLAIFEKDGHTVALRIYDFIHVTEDQLPTALLSCNKINKSKRWVKLYVDDDGDIIVEDDLIVDEQTAGEEVFELMAKMSIIADQAFKEINKAIWS